MAFAAAGCTGWDTPDPRPTTCADSGETMGAVVTKVALARQLGDGVAEGLDLDGHATAEGQEEGCYKQDFVSPDGRDGIDNQLASVMPIVDELVGNDNIDVLLEGAITNGQLLIMFAVSGVDDPMNDDCVDLHLGAGLGTPLLDTQGEYVAYQTFGFDETETPSSHVTRGRIDDGVLTVGPGRLVLPARIVDADFELDLHFAHARLVVEPDPLGGGIRLSGLVGGGLHAEDLQEIVKGLNAPNNVIGAIVPIVTGLTDLDPDEDGVCRRVSSAFSFETTPAFLYEE